jgi:two-component system, OmpR family, heavy metal sensor histidine kinase CusS
LMLRRAVNNLLSNAVRHTPKGGRIKIRVDNSDASTVVLSVQNTGETIAPAFYRARPWRRGFGAFEGRLYDV